MRLETRITPYVLTRLEQDVDAVPEYVSFAQALHAVDPSMGANVSAGHCKQDVAPEADMVPAMHTLLTADVTQYEPAGQVVAAVEPAGQK